MRNGIGKDPKYIKRELMEEDIAAPPQEQLGTLTFTLVPAGSLPSVASLSWVVSCIMLWLNGGVVFRLALCLCFDILCMATSLDNKGRGEV